MLFQMKQSLDLNTWISVCVRLFWGGNNINMLDLTFNNFLATMIVVGIKGCPADDVPLPWEHMRNPEVGTAVFVFHIQV